MIYVRSFRGGEAEIKHLSWQRGLSFNSVKKMFESVYKGYAMIGCYVNRLITSDNVDNLFECTPVDRIRNRITAANYTQHDQSINFSQRFLQSWKPNQHT